MVIKIVNSSTGVNFNVYLNAINKYGPGSTDVVLTSVSTAVSNIDGDETLTDGSTAAVRVYIVRKNAPWMFDQVGLIQGGDALMLAKPSTTVNKNDKITWNGNTYRVHNVLNRDNLGGNVAYKVCNLFKI